MENVIKPYQPVMVRTSILDKKSVKKILWVLFILALMALAVIFGSPCDIVSPSDLYGFVS